MKTKGNKMKLFTAIFLATATMAQAQTIEPNANINAIGQYDAVVLKKLALVGATMAKYSGWRCDTITSFRPFVFSTGFTLVCNQYRYTYEIIDKGGNWVIELK